MNLKELIKKSILNRSKRKVREEILFDCETQKEREGYLDMSLAKEYMDEDEYLRLKKFIEVQ